MLSKNKIEFFVELYPLKKSSYYPIMSVSSSLVSPAAGGAGASKPKSFADAVNAKRLENARLAEETKRREAEFDALVNHVAEQQDILEARAKQEQEDNRNLEAEELRVHSAKHSEYIERTTKTFENAKAELERKYAEDIKAANASYEKGKDAIATARTITKNQIESAFRHEFDLLAKKGEKF
jgi:hypothetical protein